jgi:hypothetical protein
MRKITIRKATSNNGHHTVSGFNFHSIQRGIVLKVSGVPTDFGQFKRNHVLTLSGLSFLVKALFDYHNRIQQVPLGVCDFNGDKRVFV